MAATCWLGAREQKAQEEVMCPPIFVGPLSKEAVAALAAYSRETQDADERTRCQIIALSHEGLTLPAIA